MTTSGAEVTEISEPFARVADGFTARVQAVPVDTWGRQPRAVRGWVARDVVPHLVE
jgi:hypothetical protein